MYSWCWIHHHHPSISRTLHLPKQKLYVMNTYFLPISLHPSPGQPAFYCLSLWIRPLWAPHITEVMQYVFFCVWLISFGTVSSRYIHVAADTKIAFLLRLNNIPLFVIYPSLFILHSFIRIWVVPPFGKCESCCCEHRYTNTCSSLCYQLLLNIT